MASSSSSEIGNLLSSIDNHIGEFIVRHQFDLQNDIEKMILKMSDEALIEFIKSVSTKQLALTRYQSLCIPEWDSVFNECTSKRVCECIVENMKIGDIDNLTDHLNDLKNLSKHKHVSEANKNKYKDELEWKTILVNKWISNNQ